MTNSWRKISTSDRTNSSPTTSVHTFLAFFAAKHRCKLEFAENVPDGFLLYISTDYVFDGTRPPYKPEDPPNAVNKYGQQKIAAEKFILDTLPSNRSAVWCSYENALIYRSLGNAAILRIPIIYGPVEYLAEGAVDEVLKALLANPSDKPIQLDHYHLRYPTHVKDIASAIAVLLRTRLEVSSLFASCAVFSNSRYNVTIL